MSRPAFGLLDVGRNRMILYLDTSALVKLYVSETGSPQVHEWVSACELAAVCRIAWAEACAAFARRARDVPADAPSLEQAREALANDWPHYFILELTETVVARACEYAEVFALRAYDSVQLAAASTLREATAAEVVFASFDNRLNKAARVTGMGVMPVP